jgi:S1-C subfamily serine protease
VRSGVVRIDSSTCDGGGIGTGFLIDDDLVVTAAHVVEGAASLGLTFGDESDPSIASGVVVGIDPLTDMALIRADRNLDGHVFSLADSSPDVGQSIVAIGFPQGEPMTLTSGIVSGLNRTISFEGRTYAGLIQTDAAINPGNSGGPMLDLKGTVQGVADAVRTDSQGIAYAIPARTVRSLTAKWKGNTTSVVDAACEAPTAPDRTTDFDVLPPSDDPLAVEVTQLFREYFTAINEADYQRAWELMSPRLRPSDVDSFAESLSSTIDFGVVVQSVTPGEDGTANAHVYFVSTQSAEQGPEGQTCTAWDLDYTLVPTGDPWQIRRAKAHGGGKAYHSC